jgi:multidrug efflux pump subunit AcrA (membrane-fusion protein)
MQTLPKSINPGRYRAILPIFTLALTSGLALAGCGHTSEKVEGKALAPSPASKVAAGGLQLVTQTPETEVALNLGCKKVSMKGVDFAVRSTGEVQADLKRELLHLVGKARALTRPKLAVQDAEDCKVVYVPIGKGQYREQPIKLGGESGNLEEVIGGLKEGDPIVVKGSFELRSESLKQSD